MRRKVAFLTDTGKRRLLSRYGIIYDKTTRNILRVHNKNESWGHFLTKAVLYKLFRDKGYDMLLEAATDNGIIDVREHYSRFKEILIVAVPVSTTCIDDFCQNIKNQVHTCYSNYLYPFFSR
ncbi:MAG: hypothetical protein HXS46_11360 [Theionarchaea archaeon]|nr:hypothetical protein [Theionarchaea archaeon]